MWVRKVLVILLLALFIFSISGTAGAVLKGTRAILVNPPRTYEVDPWGETQYGENNGSTSIPKSTGANQIDNSCNLIIIDKIPVVFEVEVKNQPIGAKK